MLDFTRLRGGPGGWRDSFEALVRQLGRINPPAGAATFRHIHGAGGDGGIEAYWTLINGDEVGYQAKFHQRPSDINWSALDKSISTALKTHPRLATIQVAIACDLTDEVAGRRGRTGWQQWEHHRGSWERAAANNGQSVTFELWTASELEHLLTKPEAVGLREYWFDDQILSPSWFRQKFEDTKLRLDERFHPEDHVYVTVRSVFDGLRRSPAWRKELKTFLDVIREETISDRLYRDTALQTHLTAAKNVLDLLLSRSTDCELPPDQKFDRQQWLHDIREAREAIHTTSDFLFKEIENGIPAKDRSDPNGYLRNDLSKLRQSLDELEDALLDVKQIADATRILRITGRAGSGKSHLLASEVEAAIADGEPAIMLLGTDFTSMDEPGAQVVSRLGLGAISFDQFLGMLCSAAEERGCRALLILDAINEGSGAALWRDRLVQFTQTITRHPRLAVCLSYRTEFAGNLLTETAARVGASAIVVGFETPEEQENAAKVYLDKRGIVRPATPWLSPEFTNPLFLRTACLALQRQKMSEFPRGLRGTRALLRFYLEGIARTLTTDYVGTEELLPPLREAVLAIAGHMARERSDFVDRETASAILTRSFAAFSAPAGVTWLDLLKRHGVLRADPAPAVDPDDPLAGGGSVFRFAYQRFQDHLIAEALLSGRKEPSELFVAPGPFAFMLGKHWVEYDWLGVFQALAIQFSDTWKTEIVDHLPGGMNDWWDHYGVQDAFLESVRWRNKNSFTERSRELLNALDLHQQALPLLLELALVEDHPWNSHFLNAALSRQSLLDRDAFWTLFLNEADGETGHAADRIVDWSLGAGVHSASPQVLELALIAIAWMFTSTNRRLRDRATKGAVEMLLLDPKQIDGFLSRFAKCDDVYVVERILASIAGAVLRKPELALLASASAVVWREVFKNGDVARHILLRDYATLIVELALDRRALSPEVDVSRCRPPFASEPPEFGRSDKDVDARAKAVGAETIYFSCHKHGDFGRYVIESGIRDFTAIPLSSLPPVGTEEAFNGFVDTVVKGDEEREEWFELLRGFYVLRDRGSQDDFTAETLSELEGHFLAELNEEERRRFDAEAKPFLISGGRWWGEGPTRIDVQQAQLWVVDRVLEMGWTKDRFPYDRSHGREMDRGSRTERVGKKYQWIAYHDLLARMADNYWLAEEWRESEAKTYKTPQDLEFTRDIDPTVSPAEASSEFESKALELPKVHRIEISEVAPAAMADWVFAPEIPRSRLELGLGSDLGSDEWLTLYRYSSAKLRYDEKRLMRGAPFRQDDFHFLIMVAVEKELRPSFVRQAEQGKIDFHDWLTHDYTDGPYLYEAGRRATWPEEEIVSTGGWRGPDLAYIAFSHGYHWESHLDGSLPNGFSSQVPNPWLQRALGLNADPNQPGVFLDSVGTPVVVAGKSESNHYCLVRKDRLMPLMEERNLAVLWAGIGERGAWPEVSENRGPTRRWNGLLWPIKNGVRSSIWYEDRS